MYHEYRKLSFKIVNALRIKEGYNPLAFITLCSLLLLSSFALAADVIISGEGTPIGTALDSHLDTADGNDIRWFKTLPNEGNEYTIENTSHYDSGFTNPYYTSPYPIGVGEGVTLNIVGTGDTAGINFTNGAVFYQSYGTINITGTGGTVTNAFSHGIGMNPGSLAIFQNENSVMNTTGNSGTGAGAVGYGIYIGNSDFVKEGNGVLNVIGNSGTVTGASAFGMYVYGGFAQEGGGIINATGNGGAGDNSVAHGIYAGTLSLSGNGAINAIGNGGTGHHSVGYGIFIGLGNLVILGNGIISATGNSGIGNSADGYGIYIENGDLGAL